MGTRRVELELHSDWPERFAREADAIGSVLAGVPHELHHFGSTAVPGMRAKPIIDMLLVVPDLADLDQREEGFVSLGYVPMGEFGIPGRRFFTKGGDQRSHHLHAYEHSNRQAIDRHLHLRDYLRGHPDEAKQYEALKARYARQFSTSPERYSDAKGPFIEALEAKATAWASKPRAGGFPGSR